MEGFTVFITQVDLSGNEIEGYWYDIKCTTSGDMPDDEKLLDWLKSGGKATLVPEPYFFPENAGNN